MTKSEFENLKDRISTLEKKKARAEGQMENAMKQLKDEFECNTIEEATEKLQKLKARAESLSERIDKEGEKLENEIREMEEAL